MIFLPDMPTRQIVSTPDKSLGLAFDDVTLTTEDQVQLHAWFIPHSRSRSVVLVCHGNAGNISHRMETIRVFHRLGQNVLIFDYRGYGQSNGEISELGTYQDAQAAWTWLREKGFAPEQIIVFGRSLGGGVATELAFRQPVGGLILESSFTSIADMGAELYPWLPIRWLTRTRYDNLSRISQISSPLLIIHSEDDELVPFHHSQRLFERASSPKYFYRLNGDHNNGFRLSPGYEDALRDFLSRVRPGTGTPEL